MPELTSLRFFAAWHVVFYHNFYLAGENTAIPWFFNQTISLGYTAVNFFFVLSGFILTEVYSKQGNLLTVGIRVFLIKRLARIYPLFLLALLLDAPRVILYFNETSGHPVGTIKTVVAGLANIFLLQSWFPRISSSWNSPGWSLSNEAFFYLLFPTLLVWLGKKEFKYQLKLMLVFFIISILIITPFIFIIDTENHPELFTFARFNPLLHLSEFIFGMLLAMIFRKMNSISFVQLLKKWGDLIAFVFLLGTICVAYKIPKLYFHNGLLAPIYGLFIFSSASGVGFFSKILKYRMLVFLGNASYAVYILHQPLKTYLLWTATAWAIPLSPAILFYYIVFLLTTSTLAYIYIEEPARRSITKTFC